MAGSKQRLVQVSTADGTVVAARCEVAERMFSRMRGLLGRAGLEPSEGILISPTWSVHTYFMRFPIDVVFVDRNLSVVRVVGNLVPWGAAMARGARSALELPAGVAGELGLQAGTQLVVGDA